MEKYYCNPHYLRGGDVKNVTYVFDMVKMQVLQILLLPPPKERKVPYLVPYRSQRPKHVTYIFGSL